MLNDVKESAGIKVAEKVKVFDASRYGAQARKPLRLLNAEVYLSPSKVELFSFDDDYLRRLEAEDPGTVDHFVSYFTELLRIKLRARKLRCDEIDDLIQETFLRVMRAIQRRDIQQPSRLGSYVNSVNTNVLLEHYRDNKRDSKNVDVDSVDVHDPQSDLEEAIFRQENQESVRGVLGKLSEKDQAILRARFMDDMDKDEICSRFHVKRGYLRVLVHRAAHSFKVHYRPKKSRKKATGS